VQIKRTTLNNGESIQTFGSIIMKSFSTDVAFCKGCLPQEGDNEPLYNLFLFVLLVQPISIS
jgi:hypothetical protein